MLFWENIEDYCLECCRSLFPSRFAEEIMDKRGNNNGGTITIKTNKIPIQGGIFSLVVMYKIGNYEEVDKANQKINALKSKLVNIG